MQYIKREFQELWGALCLVLAFYVNPRFVINGLQSKNAIEYAMVNVKKSIGLMVLTIAAVTVLFAEYAFVQPEEKPAEIFAVMVVHGLVVMSVLALMLWLFFRNPHQVGLMVGWFILVYWVPLWFWNMVFEIHVGFSGGTQENVFLSLAKGEELGVWQGRFLLFVAVHAIAVCGYGIYALFGLRHWHVWGLAGISMILFLLSFALIHHSHQGAKIIYVMFGMGG